MSSTTKRIDIREYVHKDKYPTVAEAFEGLKVGEKVELINDHDFQPLFDYKFSKDYPDQFEWEYSEQGPEVWRAIVTKVK